MGSRRVGRDWATEKQPSLGAAPSFSLPTSPELGSVQPRRAPGQWFLTGSSPVSKCPWKQCWSFGGAILLFIDMSHTNHTFFVIRLTPVHPSETNFNIPAPGSFPDVSHVRFPAGTDGSLQLGNWEFKKGLLKNLLADIALLICRLKKKKKKTKKGKKDTNGLISKTETDSQP